MSWISTEVRVASERIQGRVAARWQGGVSHSGFCLNYAIMNPSSDGLRLSWAAQSKESIASLVQILLFRDNMFE